MQGVILDEMRQFIAERYGFAAWVETLKRSGLGPTHHYQLDQAYPDEELGLLARHAAEVTGTPPLELLEQFGEALVPELMRVYAYLVDPGWSYADFMLHMEPLLVEILRLHTPGATQAKIQVRLVAPDRVSVTYDSPLRACAAVEGVLRGAAREYGVHVQAVQEQCVLRGAPVCVFDIRFAPAGASTTA